MKLPPELHCAEYAFSRRSLGRLVALACASLICRSAQAGDPEWINKYIPTGLAPLFANAVAVASGYNDVTTVSAVATKILDFLEGDYIRSQEALLEALQNKLLDSIAVVLWLIQAVDRANRTGTARSMARTALQEAALGQSVDAATLGNSGTTVEQALDPVQFERRFDYETTNGWWRGVFALAKKPDKPPTKLALVDGRELEIVYDWRLGLPQLMQLISLRIQVIAAADQQFRERRSVFAHELLEYKDALEQHMRKMADAVQCASGHIIRGNRNGHSDTLNIVCADMYTGAFWVNSWTSYNATLFPDVRGTEIEFQRTVMDAMPFSKMQIMINTLNLLAFNSPDTADGTLMREASRPEVYIVHGGAKFHVPSWDQFNAMGLDVNAIQEVGDGSIIRFGIIPRDGTLLRELSLQEVYIFRDGMKVHVPSGNEFNRAGLDWNAIRVVPDDSTSWMPTGLW
jgi:hypothetical protein